MALLCWSFAVASALLGQSGREATRVAVVSIPVVSEKYQKTGDLEAQFEGVRKRLNQEREAMRDRIDKLNRSLQEELKPGTEEYRQRVKELALLEAEMKWFVEAEGQKVEQGLSDSLREIYKDIQEAVRQIAEQKGLDIVLASDQVPEGRPESSTQVRQQILLQKVVYWNPRVDITEEVVTRLNANYSAKRPAPPPATGAAQPK